MLAFLLDLLVLTARSCPGQQLPHNQKRFSCFQKISVAHCGPSPLFRLFLSLLRGLGWVDCVTSWLFVIIIKMPICFMGDKLSLHLLCFDVDFYIMMSERPCPILVPYGATSRSKFPSEFSQLVCLLFRTWATDTCFLIYIYSSI